MIRVIMITIDDFKIMVSKMRIYAEEQKVQFKPVKLTIELASLEEVREFYSIFNTARVTNRLKYIDHNKIRQVLRAISEKFQSNCLDI